MKMLCRCLLPVLALALMGSAKKTTQAVVRFHTEANAHDTDTFATPVMFHNPPRQAYIQKVAVISERNILAYYPIPAADGTMGAVLKLDELGRIQLETISVDHRGSSIVVFVNGRQVIDMVIDKRVSDGIVTIPSGLSEWDIGRFKKEFKLLGGKKRN